jgi:nitrogen regulatory protein PII
MKLIVAIVKPFKVVELVDALRTEPGFPGMTVLNGRGFGRRRHRTGQTDTGQFYDFLANEVVLVAAPDDQSERLAARIAEIAHTGRPGDGKVLVLPIETAIAIATGERGEPALG